MFSNQFYRRSLIICFIGLIVVALPMFVTYSVQANNISIESNPSLASSTDTLYEANSISAAILTVDKSAIVSADNRTVTYTINVANAGNLDASSSIVDPFPDLLSGVQCTKKIYDSYTSPNLALSAAYGGSPTGAESWGNAPLVLTHNPTGIIQAGAIMETFWYYTNGQTQNGSWISEIDFDVAVPAGSLYGVRDLGDDLGLSNLPGEWEVLSGGPLPIPGDTTAEGIYSFRYTEDFDNRGATQLIDNIVNTAQYTITYYIGPIVLPSGDLNDSEVVPAGGRVEYECAGSISNLLQIDKLPDTQTVTTGGNADFYIVVNNATGADLSAITTDILAPNCDRSMMFPIGLSTYTCTDVGVTSSYTNSIEIMTTVDLVNVVTVSSPQDPSSPHTAMDTTPVFLFDEDTGVVEVEDEMPDLGIGITTGIDEGGDTITHTITVTNTGNVTVTTTVNFDLPPDIVNPQCTQRLIYPIHTFTSPNLAPGNVDGVNPLTLSFNTADIIPSGTVLRSYDFEASGIANEPSYQYDINLNLAHPGGSVYGLIDFYNYLYPGTFGEYTIDSSPTGTPAGSVGTPIGIDTDPASGTYSFVWTEYYDDAGPLFIDNRVDTSIFEVSYSFPDEVTVLPPGSTVSTTVVLPAGAHVDYECVGDEGSLNVNKTPDIVTIESGDTVTFTIIVENITDEPIYGEISDPLVPACDRMQFFPPGITSYDCVDVAVTSSYTNVITATSMITSTGMITATSPDLPGSGVITGTIPPAMGGFPDSDGSQIIVGGACTTRSIAGVDIAQMGMDSLLTWVPDGDAIGYEVWWGIDKPYMTPDPSCAAPGADHGCQEPTLTDQDTMVGHVGDPAQNYYYYVMFICSDGTRATGKSNHVGEFDFAIVPGS